MSEDVSKYHKNNECVLCDFQREMEEEEDNQAEMSRPAMQVHKR